MPWYAPHQSNQASSCNVHHSFHICFYDAVTSFSYDIASSRRRFGYDPLNMNPLGERLLQATLGLSDAGLFSITQPRSPGSSITIAARCACVMNGPPAGILLDWSLVCVALTGSLTMDPCKKPSVVRKLAYDARS